MELINMHDDSVDTTITAYNTNADKYAVYRPLIPPVKKRLDFFAEQVIETDQRRVLDIGCGPGRDSAYLLSKGLKVSGIDMSEKLLEMARENVKGVDFQHMDMRHLDFSDNSFGGLWVNTSFLHVPKKDGKRTLQEFNRVLGPDGLLFLGIQGHRNEQGEVTSQLSESEVMIKNPDFSQSRLFVIYDDEEIKKLLTDSGFEIIQYEVREEPDTKIKWLNIFAKKVK